MEETTMELLAEADKLILDLLPPEDFGENEKAERLYNIVKELEQRKIVSQRPGARAEANFNEIYDLLEDRLNQLGEIRTEAAWQICRHKYGYATVTQAFRKIMLTMVEQGKAKKIKNGHYKIVAANVKETHYR